MSKLFARAVIGCRHLELDQDVSAEPDERQEAMARGRWEIQGPAYTGRYVSPHVPPPPPEDQEISALVLVRRDDRGEIRETASIQGEVLADLLADGKARLL